MNIDHLGDSLEWDPQLFLYFCLITHGWSLGHLTHSLFDNCNGWAIVKLIAIATGCYCCSHFIEYSSVKIGCCLCSGIFGLIVRGGMDDLNVIFDILAFIVQLIPIILKLRLKYNSNMLNFTSILF